MTTEESGDWTKLPETLQQREPQRVVYTLQNAIRGKIFNYKETVADNEQT